MPKVSDAPVWLRLAAFAAPVLLVAAVAAAIVLTSDAGPQPTTAATVARQAGGEAGNLQSPDPQAAPAPCENGTVVPNPASNPGLVADCALLLAARDALRGTAALDWSAGTAIGDWTGITLGGAPQRVTRVQVTYAGLDGTVPAALAGLEQLQRLQLGGNALTGTIPAQLGELSQLLVLHLGGNELSGALPPELASLERITALTLGDNQLTGPIPETLFGLPRLDYLNLSANQLTGPIPPVRNDRADMSGIRLHDNQLSGTLPVGLGELGLSLLQLGGNQFTGCIPQGLRDATTHDLDGFGLSDCATTTTYKLHISSGPNGSISPPPGHYLYLDGTSVTVQVTPAAGYRVALWDGDCLSAITATTCTLTMDTDRWAHIVFKPQIRRLDVTAAGEGSVTPSGRSFIQAGYEATVTASWNDATHELSWGGDCAGTTGSVCTLLMDANKNVTATFTELPANRCATPTDADCTLAVYRGAPDDYTQAVDIPADVLLTPDADGRYRVERGQQVAVVTAAPLPAGWTRFWLERTPLEFGTPSPTSFEQLIQPVGTTYTFTPTDEERGATLITFELKAARPFVRPRPDGKPEIGATVVTTVFSVETTSPRYNSYDTTGAVATAGSYAFLDDPADTTSAVTTYEALRDGTTTALLIHKSDAHDASQAALYDAVEAGDLFEWHEADDCFVRYKVTHVKPDPTGTVPRKLLAVEWLTYAFTGCSGWVSASAVATVDWGELPDLGGASLTVPIRHGPFQLVPETWGGAVENPESHNPPSYDWDIAYLVDPDPAIARTFPYWREPALPAGWALRKISRGTVDDPPFGYTAVYATDTGSIGVRISGYYASARGWAERASWSGGVGVNETRVIDGRPARAIYSPSGPNHSPTFPVTVWVYDPATQAEYVVYGYTGSLLGGNVDAVIAIARSLFESPNPQ